MPEAWELVGRQRELDLVADAVRRPDRAGVVIIGPAGVGKSRLLLACLERGQARGFATVTVHGSAVATDIPFGALAAQLPAEATWSGGVEALAAAKAVLKEGAGDRPLLLAVDDAHLLDDASALVVQQLAADLTAFVALTVRTGEPSPDPITALWKEDLAARIDVGPLDRESVVDLLGRVLGGPIDPATEATLWDRSRGNALYLHELVVGALEAGALTADHGTWSLRTSGALPTRLIDIVGARLRRLEEAERTALGLVAFGEPIGVLLLEQVADPSVLERLERLGLITVTRDGLRLDARLSHPLHGEVLRQESGPLETRARRRSLADLIDGVGARRREDAFRLAVWRLDGGGDITADRLVAAAVSARETGDLDLAERLARSAIERGGGFSASGVLADCLYRAGDHDAARAVLDSLDGDDLAADELALLAIARADVALWGQGRGAEAIEVLADASTRLDGSPRARADVESMRAMVESHSGLVGPAIERALPLLGAPLEYATFESAIAVTAALTAAGRPVEARSIISTILAEPDLFVVVRVAALNAEVMPLVDLGALIEAGDVAAEAHRLALEINNVTQRGYSASVRAWVHLARGRLDDARRAALESTALFGASGQPVGRRWSLGTRLLAAARANRVDECRELIALLDAQPRPDGRLYETLEERGRAWFEVATGRRDEAVERLRADAARCEAAGQLAHAVVSLHDLSRLGVCERDTVDRLRAGCDGPLILTLADHITAKADLDDAWLAEVAEQLATFGADLVAAEAAADASEASSARGDRRSAARHAERSRQLSDRLGPGTAGVQVALPDTVVPLTRREREIATLAAGGRTSRAVAEQLFLSPRTVENHLSRIYDKLGVNSRAALAEALQR